MTDLAPATYDSLVDQLSSLDLRFRRSVLVHCSMRALGPIDGGVATLLAALRHVIGDQASIVVPTQTANNSTTSPIFRTGTRGLTPAEVAEFTSRIEGFDVVTTPSVGMGAFAEYVRTHPAAVRSSHPQTSFAVWGSDAHELTRVHDLDCHLGDRSPLGALYHAGATVLLLGVGFRACTAFHLAEYQVPHRPLRAYRCFVNTRAGRQVCDFKGVDLDDSDFEQLGAAYAASAGSELGHARVAGGTARAMPLRGAVDFAVRWMVRNR